MSIILAPFVFATASTVSGRPFTKDQESTLKISVIADTGPLISPSTTGTVIGMCRAPATGVRIIASASFGTKRKYRSSISRYRTTANAPTPSFSPKLFATISTVPIKTIPLIGRIAQMTDKMMITSRLFN